jgi:hypothetical protein
MPQLRLLYLDANHLSASLWQSGTLREEAQFVQDETGYAAFAEYLARHRTSNFCLLADIAEEGFQIETLPYTQGADRSSLLARKLGQFFYGSPLVTAVSYGREKSGRRDERILFTALTRPQLFEPWLAALRSAEAQLKGVYSLPLLGPGLLAKLPAADKHCLLVSITRSGIRQSFIEDGELKFSRLSPLTTAGTADVAASCAAEAKKIYQYLLGQRLLARGAPLQVVVLAHPAEQGAFLENCKSTDELRISFQDLHAACKACGLKSLPKDTFSESLYLHQLAEKTPKEQFAPDSERHFYRLWQINSWLLKGGAVVLFACLLLAAREMGTVLELRAATSMLQLQAESDQQKYNTIQKTFPPMPTSTENLRAVVGRFEDLERRSASLEPLLQSISRALDNVPKADVERIQWQLGGNPDDGTGSSSDARKGTAPVAPGDKPAGAMYAIAQVHGLLPASMAADQRGQIETVNAFANGLRQDKTLKVAILRMPFDIESGKSLKSTEDAERGLSQLKFVIQVSRKL